VDDTGGSFNDRTGLRTIAASVHPEVVADFLNVGLVQFLFFRKGSMQGKTALGMDSCRAKAGTKDGGIVASTMGWRNFQTSGLGFDRSM
jgi:hypothetical protein